MLDHAGNLIVTCRSHDLNGTPPTLGPMPTDYHRIAGGSLDRLTALSDGIFAVVMTLLVLDLRVPVVEGSTPRRPCGTSSCSSGRGCSLTS
jgi:hypothetical protein